MKAVLMNEKDNVAVALTDLAAGEVVIVKAGEGFKEVRAGENIPRGHKIALTNIEKGEPVIKYGEVIGLASRSITEGSHVHIHNVVGQRGKGLKSNHWGDDYGGRHLLRL